MKSLISIISLALAAIVAFTSCSKELEGISINPESVTMKVGETRTLKINCTPDGADKPAVTWTSSDTNIAVVSKGKVTTMRAGAVVITATAGEFTASCNITVENDTPIEGTSNISLIGTFLGTNWDVDYQLAEVETNVYVIKHVTLTDTDKFKIRFNGNWDVNRGTEVENFDVELNKGFAVVEHGKDVIPHWNGTYDIWYNQAKEQMAVVEKDGQPVWAD